METLKRIPFKARKSVFEKLEKIADLSSLSKAERIKYDASIKAYRDHLATIAYGKEEGKAEGKAEGERNKQIEIARKLKAKGLSIDLITETTGLSVEEVERL
jgi:predicted transposase/invertase (TIGR01784 family)